jgi:hypothetical protein
LADRLLRRSEQHFKEDEGRLRSVTQEGDLDEFLNTAQLAATDFTAGASHSVLL